MQGPKAKAGAQSPVIHHRVHCCMISSLTKDPTAFNKSQSMNQSIKTQNQLCPWRNQPKSAHGKWFTCSRRKMDPVRQRQTCKSYCDSGSIELQMYMHSLAALQWNSSITKTTKKSPNGQTKLSTAIILIHPASYTHAKFTLLHSNMKAIHIGRRCNYSTVHTSIVQLPYRTQSTSCTVVRAIQAMLTRFGVGCQDIHRVSFYCQLHFCLLLQTC